MGKTYGVLLVAGDLTHQENYGAAFGRDPRCRVVAVTDEPGVPERRDRLNRRLARRFGIPFIPDLADALKRDDVHVASICVEFERRAQVAAQCARAGKHVYVDKPLTVSNREASALVSEVGKAGVRSQMFSMFRTPWAQRARRLTDSGALGQIVSMHSDLLFSKGHTGTADLDRPRQEHYPPRRFTYIDSKRELFTMGVYSIGIMRWLSGRAVKRVYARTANYFFREHQKNNVEDFAALTMEFEGGLVGTLSGGRIGWLSHLAGGISGIFLAGTRGCRFVDGARPRFEVACDAPAWRPGPPHPDDPMGFWRSSTREAGGVHKFNWRTVPGAAGSDESYFIDCIEQNRESDMSVAEAAEVLKVLMAGYESAATGKVVSI